jgi:hypothetical protein
VRTPDPQIPNLGEPVRGTHLLAFLAWIKRTVLDLAQAWLTVKIVNQAAYTLELADDGKYLRFLLAGTLTVPPRSSVQFRGGAVIHVRTVGGQVAVAPGPGVTVNTPATLRSRTAHSSLMLVHVSENEWDLLGDLEPL